jgi:sodium transport system permease protein
VLNVRNVLTMALDLLGTTFVVAAKELTDHTRDTRSVISAGLYALMGPAVVLLVFAARGERAPAASGHPAAVMAATFALIAAFTGAIAVATDLIAGERERRSLVPLLVSSSSRSQIVIGKWLAAATFAAGSVLLSVFAFRTVLAVIDAPIASLTLTILVVPPLVSLALLAAAVEILVSMLCRTSKEAQTYLSMLVFGTMALAMWVAFRPHPAAGWSHLVPMIGQQRLLEVLFSGGPSSALDGVLIAFRSAMLATVTVGVTAVVVAVSSKVFRRDEAVYGG